MMKAVAAASAVGPPEVLALAEVPRPVAPASRHAVWLRVRATAVNRADLLQRAGRYPPPPGASPILGLEAAGEMDDGNGGASRVMALLSGGGYAEEAWVDRRHTMPVPDGWSYEQVPSAAHVYPWT
jgi:NADPH:quinone reductase